MLMNIVTSDHVMLQHWALQQVTVPSNFKKILQVTNEGKDDGKNGEVITEIISQ